MLTTGRVASRLGRRFFCSGATEEWAAAQRLKEAVVDGAVKVKNGSSSPTLLERYAHALQEKPLLTNAVTSGALCALGDVLAQAVEWRVGAHGKVAMGSTGGPPEGTPPPAPDHADFDAARTARMGVYGFFVCGPLLTGWYQGLNIVGEALSVSYKPVISWLPGWYRELPGASPAKLLATKVVADSLLFQAPFLTLYFGVMGALEGLSPRRIYEKTKESFHQAWALSLLVWTPVQCVNLFYVPAAWQPFVVSAVNVGWKSTLSLLNHYHARGDHAKEEAESNEALLNELRAEIFTLRAQLTFVQAQNDAWRARQTGSWWRAWTSRRPP